MVGRYISKPHKQKKDKRTKLLQIECVFFLTDFFFLFFSINLMENRFVFFFSRVFTYISLFI